MKSLSRPFPISLAAHESVADSAAGDAGGPAATRPSLHSLRTAVVALGFSVMVRAAMFLKNCNY